MKKEIVINGVYNFIKEKILPAMPAENTKDTMRRWGAAFGAGLIKSQANSLLDMVTDHPYLSGLGIMSKDGDIDVDTLLEVAKSTAKDYGQLELSIPLIGKFPLGEKAFETLGKYIEAAAK